MAQDNPHGEPEPGAGALDGRTDDGPQVADPNPWARPGSAPAGGADAPPAAEHPTGHAAGIQPDAGRPETGQSDAGQSDAGQWDGRQPGFGQPGAGAVGPGAAAGGEPVTDPPTVTNHTAHDAPWSRPTQDQAAHDQAVHDQAAHDQTTGPTAPYQLGARTSDHPVPGYPSYGPGGAPPYPGPSHPVPGFGAGPYPGAPYPAGPYPAAAGDARPTRRNRVVGLVAAGAVLALVAGGIGGAVGADIVRSGGGGSGGGGVISGALPEIDPDAPVTPVEQIAARVLPSVVQLRVEGGALARGELGEGSGMVVSADGLILTNNHVVEPAASGGTLRTVFQDGRTAPVRIVGRDPESDIALVKADNVTGLTPVELGNSDGVRVGQPVTAFGSPLGLGGSVTTGIVSALNRAVSVGGGESGATASSTTVLSALQTDAAINPGNSGGPLVDMQGRVVGINSAIATAGPGGGSIGVGFSIPVNQAKRIADQLRTTGRATHAVLGVEVTDDPSRTGALVQTVDPAGAAGRAGLKPGDVVVRLGSQPTTGGTELQAAVRSQTPGATVDVQLANGTVRPVTLGEK